MARKQRTSFLEDVFYTATKLPWWVCIILAAAVFLAGHMLATIKPGKPMTPEAMFGPALVGLGIVVELLGPLVFLLAAVVSGFSRLQTKRVDASKALAPSTQTRPTVERNAPPSESDLYETWKDVSKTEASRPSVDTSRWSKELLNALEWKRFEHLCAGYFETLGFKARVAREGADGGVDIHLYAEGSPTPAIVVQCKAWKVYNVGVKPIRELLGVMTALRVSEGVFVTTGTYTSEAKQFAAGNNIQLIDGDDLLGKIAATTPERERALLELATAGDFTTPTCPSCGTAMIERVAQKTGERFWGCPGYPSCRRTFRLTSR